MWPSANRTNAHFLTLRSLHVFFALLSKDHSPHVREGRQKRCRKVMPKSSHDQPHPVSVWIRDLLCCHTREHAAAGAREEGVQQGPGVRVFSARRTCMSSGRRALRGHGSGAGLAGGA